MDKDHAGKPPGGNKEDSTRVKPVIPAENLERDEEATEKFSTDEDQIADNPRERHPNRNTGKEDSTNAGGYKN